MARENHSACRWRRTAAWLAALLVLLAAAPAGAAAAQTAKGPVVALSFIGGAAGTKKVNGRFGTGIAFRKRARIRLAKVPAIASARRLTLELWVKASRGRAAQELLAVRGKRGARYGLRLVSGRLRTVVKRGRNSKVVSGPRLKAGRWRFVASTFDGRRIRTYVGRKRVSKARVRRRLLPVGGTVQLGGGRFHGAIDNVRIYTRVLSRKQLAADGRRDVGRNQIGAPPTSPGTPGAAPNPSPPGSTPSRSRNCMPDPSACGLPDVETTGVLPGVARETVNGDVTLSSPGQVYANKTVNGSISVTTANVTIRNVKLVLDPGADYGIQAFSFSSGVSNLVVEDSEIDLNGNLDSKGIAFDQYTLRRVFIHNGSDCAHTEHSVVIEDSLCALGPDANSDGWPDNTSWCNGPEHRDGFQSDGGDGLTFRHNTIRNNCKETSAILMSTNTSPIANVSITNNLMAGGGYTLYCNAENDDVPNETVTGNRFSKVFFRDSGFYGPITGCSRADVYSGNVWDENSKALPAG
jgi:hypothetical protein